MAKTIVCLACGGQSTEHEVSLQSAKNVLEAIDKDKYEILLVGIDKKGVWNLYVNNDFVVNGDDPAKIALSNAGSPSFPMLTENGPVLVELNDRKPHPFDVMFPILHGHNGEDGAFQGLCQMLNCPCVGCGLSASANCMDKDLTKQLLAANGIRVAKGIVLRKGIDELDTAAVAAKLGMPVFVKPARTGSSVGVTKAHNVAELEAAVTDAFKYDNKLLIEECVVGREIECAVLGTNEPFAALPGEVIPQVEFYSYDAKYIMGDGAQLSVPAKLTVSQQNTVREIAVKAFKVLECNGMSRIDFFLRNDGQWVLNEINTIPGFTNISMYPRMMQASGITYSSLIDKLIQFSLQG